MSNGPLTIGRVVDICKSTDKVLEVVFGTPNPYPGTLTYTRSNLLELAKAMKDVDKDKLVDALIGLYHARESIKNSEFPGGG